MEVSKYVSDMSVLCGAELLEGREGKQKGLTLVRVYNGKWQLFLAVDRALDPVRADYCGGNVGYLSKNGAVAPGLLSEAANFSNSFPGGFLYTCGLDNIGTPRQVDGRTLVQHGSLSYLPAEHVNLETGWEEGRYFVRVSGEIHYTALFGSHLVLRRSYRLFCGGDEVELVDELENREFAEDRYMLLYHCNLGYPFLTERARVELPAGRKTEYVNERARARAAFAEEIEKPTPKCPEEVFCHTLPSGDCQVAVRGERQTFTLSFSAECLPYLTQWKSMSAGDYVLGVEPCTTKLFDRRPTAIGAGATHRFALRFAMRGNAEA